MNSPKIINEVLSYLNLNPSQLAKALDLKRAQNIYDIQKGKTGISKDVAARVNSKYPEINKEYLLTGDGNLLNQTNNNTKIYNEVIVTNHQNIDQKNMIPIYDIEIDAGNITRLIDDNDNVPIAGHVYLKDSQNSSGLVGVRARGDSMATFIMGGDTMLIRRIHNKDIIPPGHPYVVVTPEYTTVKYIRKGSDKTTWTLRSHNTFYEDFEIKKTDVVHLFMVVKVLKELTY